MKKWGWIGFLVALGVLLGATSSWAITPKKKIKAAFVFVGPIGDAGWTYAHNQGRLFLEKALPYVETAYTESVPEGGEAERVITQYARRGYNLIFTTSFGYMDSTIKVAKQFPDTVFMHCSGFKVGPNVGTYFGRMYQAKYLAGLIAGKMATNDTLGYVAPHPIPEVIRHVNAYTLGVRAIRPKAKVHVVWTNSWYDPAKEREAAESLLDIGSSIMSHGQDSPATIQAAAKRGKFVFGYDSDMTKFSPEYHLTAPMWNWGVLYVQIAKAVHDGTWKNDQLWPGMESGVVKLAPFNKAVPADALALVKEKMDAIKSGRLKVFQGPIKDQTGKARIPAGKAATDGEMLSMNYFIEGVVGQVPGKTK
ncbi:MAG: BMP family ABC transporter substrate-binding protein [Nitrospinota bacterium]